MSIRNNIIEAIQNKNDSFYYKANDAEQELFALKALTNNEDTIKRIENLILELNNIRMDEYKRETILNDIGRR